MYNIEVESKNRQFKSLVVETAWSNFVFSLVFFVEAFNKAKPGEGARLYLFQAFLTMIWYWVDT